MRKIFRNDWAELLDDELKEPYYQDLRKFLIDEYSTKKSNVTLHPMSTPQCYDRLS